MDHSFVRTLCPYCGTGCGLILEIRDGRPVATHPDREHPVSRGNLCIKGYAAHQFIGHPDRLTTPLLRQGDRFVALTWDEALALAADRLQRTVREQGADAVGGLCSAKCTNEENYLFQKIFRLALGTNNVDHCARLCHAPTTVAMARALGSGAMTNAIADLGQTDCLIVIGSNAAENHPIIMGEIYRAVERGARLIAVDPRRTAVAQNAFLHLPLRPGTDIPLLAAMMRHILDSGRLNRAFIAERMEGFDALEVFLRDWPVGRAAKECGLPADLIYRAAETYARAGNAAIVYCMGITQHACGTANVLAICDLAMLCGQVGKPAAGIYPLRGQNNVQGACDMGGLPTVYPGYQAVADPAVQVKFEQAWGGPLPAGPGLTVTEMIAASGRSLRSLYILAENPALSDPDVNHVLAALPRLDFLIVQDLFLTETARLAHLVLPGACFAEKTGTFTNTERRFQLLHKAVDPPGEARDDYAILCDLARRLGRPMTADTPAAAMAEIASLVPAYAGISHRRLGLGGLQWPCPHPDHPGTSFLHEGRFTRGKGLFVVPAHTPPREPTDDAYPFILTTGRMFAHYHTATMTRRSAFLDREAPLAYVEIAPADAARLDIADGDAVTVSSRRGSIRSTARVTDRVPPGLIFAPFHFTEARANVLTNPVLDPASKIPEFKVCAVRLEKGAGGTP